MFNAVKDRKSAEICGSSSMKNSEAQTGKLNVHYHHRQNQSWLSDAHSVMPRLMTTKENPLMLVLLQVTSRVSYYYTDILCSNYNFYFGTKSLNCELRWRWSHKLYWLSRSASEHCLLSRFARSRQVHDDNFPGWKRWCFARESYLVPWWSFYWKLPAYS